MKATPQQKLIHVNDGFGNTQLAQMQGSTVEIYDTVDLPSSGGNNVVLDFFIDAKTKSFPDTNLKDGKLPPQESFIMERIRFGYLETKEGATTVIPFWGQGNPLVGGNGAAIQYGAQGEFEFRIANQRVLKPLALDITSPANNQGKNNINNVFEFDTMLAITPQLEFTLSVKLDEVPAAEDGTTRRALICYIGGAGAIFSPKANF